MTSWWSGAITATNSTSHATTNPQNVALIIGATGIVGTSLATILPLPDTPGGPWKLYALSRRPRPPFLPNPPNTQTLLCDISNPSQTLATLSPLTDITHIFYTAWTNLNSEAQNIAANTAMLRNVLAALLPNAPNLQHVCLQTGLKHYVGSFDSLTNLQPHDTPFHENLPRLPAPNFYYAQEDVLFDSLRGKAVTFSIHRPSLIFGYSPTSLMNIVCTLCVYAAICKREGDNKSLRWPGSKDGWENLNTASDADLVAEQQIWAAVDMGAKNEAFNCSNGDVFKWKHLWAILAEKFGFEGVGYRGEEERFELRVAMEGKEGLWDLIVKENGLAEMRLEEVANWWFADAALNFGGFLDSMNKSKERGFFGFRNTSTSFASCIDKLKGCKIVP